MRRLLPLLSLLLALVVAAPASAQTPAASPGATPQALTGLEYAAARQYTVDPGQPAATGGDALFILSVRIYAFDTDAHADAGWDSTRESSAIQADLPEDSDKVTFTEAELEGLGDRAWVTTLAAETPDGETGYFRLVYVQDGTMLYTLSAIAGSAEATLATDALAEAMVEAEPGDGAVTFREDGTSTGGVWDLFPAAGDAVLGDLVAFADAELDLRAGQ